MKLIASVKCNIELMHKYSGKIVMLDKEIKMEYDEESQEYKDLCERYKDVIGFSREQDKDKYDQFVLTNIAKDIKEGLPDVNGVIPQVVRSVYSVGGAHGYIETMGYIVNVEDFSYIKFNPFDIRITKK